jgi:putative tributyrin esterase
MSQKARRGTTQITIARYSRELSKCVRSSVLVPENIAPPFKTLYILHGRGQNDSSLLRESGIKDLHEQYPFLMVFPDMGLTWSCDSPVGNGESYIVKELIPFIDAVFPTRKNARARAVCGISMGGYGALRLAFKYPNVFSAVSGCEASLLFGHSRHEVLDACTEIPIIHGDNPGTHDLFEIAASSRSPPSNIYFDCGKKDLLLNVNKEFHRHLLRLGIKHTFRIFSGTHGMHYATKQLPRHFQFLWNAMGR